ncbi:MAG: putative Ig domain-containing protein [Holophaga sp.]|nr:putative Ig domain-containing protein [Holophaga sp.]
MSLNPTTGVISGTPTATGTYTASINLCNAAGSCTTQSITITVVVAAPGLLNYATPVVYTTTVPVTNNPNPTGGLPTSYSIVGSLPAGLSLDPTTGVISGTPTAATAGVVSVTITGTNATGSTFQTVNITVLAYPTASLTANPSVVPVGQSSSLTALFTGAATGTAVISGGNLSGPVTVTSGTSIPTGIEATPVTHTYTLTVTNSVGVTVTSTTTVQWIPVPADTWTVTIPPGGGGPYVPGAGNLLNGQISVTVPNQGQSTCGDVTLTVNKETPLPGAILGSARDYSNTFNISSNLGYPFRVPITITLKYDPTLASPNLGAADLPVPFYWDPSYNKWVATGFKAIDTVNRTVTFTTLLPGRYTVLGIPGLTLANQSLGFASATDDWRQNNPSVYDLPGGASLGMSSFASWYFPFEKVVNGGIGLYNVFPSLTDANAQALISRIGNGTVDSWKQVWNQQNYTLTNKQTGLALITGLMVTGQPQIFLMGDARPAVNTSVAAAVYGYNAATGKFNVMDPNYPGNALTITWNSGTGAFSLYDRAAGYSPQLVQFAFEGQTSIHRLADYDRVFSGAATGFPTVSFATISVDNIGGTANPDITQTVLVGSATSVTVSGTVTDGDENATHIFWSQNGTAPRTAVPLTPIDATHSSFTFTIPALADPYGTTVAIETTATPCDPTFSHSGFQKFVVKQTGLSPWLPNICFEDGSSNPWVLQQSGNSGSTRRYPMNNMTAVQATAAPTWNLSGEISNYNVTGTWVNGSIDSAIVAPGTDAHIPAINTVLDGTFAFRVNDQVNGSHLSRLYQSITVPSTVAAPKLTFYWAAVLEDPGHPASEQPYVDVLVQNLDDVTLGYPKVLYYAHFYGGDQTYPGWIVVGGWKGIPWQKVSLNLGASATDRHLKITVTASDCTRGGHGGYAYIDSVGCQ